MFSKRMKIFFSAFGWAVDDDDKHCKYAYLHLSRASQVADKRQSAMRIEGDGIVRRDMMCQHCRTLGPLRVCVCVWPIWILKQFAKHI